MKLSCENFISKGGRIFEITTRIWSEYVYAGRIIPLRNTQFCNFYCNLPVGHECKKK